MKPFNWRIPLGLVLVILGVLAFLQSFQIITMKGDPWLLTFAVIFAAVGVIFLYALLNDRRNWWAAIPGLTLLGLGALMGLELIPGFPSFIPPAIFMGSIAAAFWVVYAMNRTFWWAIIPAGTLTSLALLIGLGDSGSLGASVLFMGMAATFGVLGLIEINGQHMSWPWIPAICLAVLSAVVGVTSSGVPSIVWAILIILAGIFLIARPYIMNRKR
jgi:hypothetical protein